MASQDALNAALDAIVGRVAEALELPPERIYEYRASAEQKGEAGYFQAKIPSMSGLGACASDALVECTIGFHKEDDPTKRRRIQRTKWAFAIRDRLMWGPGSLTAPIPGVNMPEVVSMDLSEVGDPDRGHLMGGLVYRFHIALQDGL